MRNAAACLLLILSFLLVGCGAHSPESIPPLEERKTLYSGSVPESIPSHTVPDPPQNPITSPQNSPEPNITAPEPAPDPEPATDTGAQPEANPKPVPEPTPETESTPEPTPEPPVETGPIPDPVPEPTPAPEPDLPAEPTAVSSKLPILMYHHVVPNGTECNDMTVTVNKLEADLQWLSQHGYTAILPRDLSAGTPLPERPILITFDDGYRSNYELAYPLLQQYATKAVISVMLFMQQVNVTSFLSWEMCREMSDSGLIEIGSHTCRLHNLDDRNGSFTPGGINGIQRKPGESDADFQTRVLDDVQRSHDLLEEKLERDVTFFAYPFGIREPDAEALIEELFPVTVVTLSGTADLSAGTKNMPRWTVTMNTHLSSILEP